MDHVVSSNVPLPVPITDHEQAQNKQLIKTLTEKISLSGISKDKLESLNNILFELYNTQIKKFQYSICIETVKECLKLWKELINGDKINDIILAHELRDHLNFENDQVLFDLKHLTSVELNLEESLKLEAFVANKIKSKYERIFKKIDDSSGGDILKPLPYQFNEINPELLALKLTLNQKQNEYITAIANLASVIKNIIDMREKLQDKIENKVSFLKLQIEICVVKLKITQIKLYDKNFNETPETGKAVEAATKDLRKETEQLVNEILQMEKDLKIIENISPQSELGILIKQYVNYKEEIGRLENLLNEISNKHN